MGRSGVADDNRARSGNDLGKGRKVGCPAEIDDLGARPARH